MSITSTLLNSGNTLSQVGENMTITAHNIANVNTPDFQAMDYYAPFTSDGLMYYGGFVYDNADLFPTVDNMSDVLGSYQDEVMGIAKNDVVLASEYIRLIQNEHELDANAKVMSTADSMNGYLMDLTI